MQIQPYLYFDGRCEEAVNFYKTALGAQVDTMMRFKESPDPSMCTPGTSEKIMHCSFRVGTTTVLASDGRCQGKSKFEGFSLTLLLDSEAEGERLFAALSAGGQVQMPLAKTFFAKCFGMVADRFGVCWMILVRA